MKAALASGSLGFSEVSPHAADDALEVAGLAARDGDGVVGGELEVVFYARALVAGADAAIDPLGGFDGGARGGEFGGREDGGQVEDHGLNELRAESLELRDRTAKVSKRSALDSEPASDLFLNNALLAGGFAVRYDGGAKAE